LDLARILDRITRDGANALKGSVLLMSISARHLLALAIGLSQFLSARAPAQEAEPTTNAQAPVSGGSVGRGAAWDLVRRANPMLWPLGACSVVMVGFALERFVALRRSKVIPKDFAERFLERLASGKLDRERAIELARANESTLARVFQNTLRYWGQPAATIRQASDHDSAGEITELKRNVRVLNGTATLAPLLGLLGTVVGMIESFEALSSRAVSSGRSEALAHGISLALVATAIGLVIAAVSVVLYYYFLHKIDLLVRELDEKNRAVIDLIASDTGRPIAERRAGSAADGARAESRSYARVDPL
jgi:biopolymer transport protein ExbB